MISYLRHRTVQRGLFLALCVLIIPGFIFWGTTQDSSPLNGTAGVISGRKIKAQEFIRNFEAMRRELQVFGGMDLRKISESVDLEQLAWQRILLVQAAKDSGLRVTDKELIEWLQHQPVFEEDGAFSDQRYKQILERYLKMDAKAFEEETREYIALQRYRDQIRGSYAPQESEVRDRYRLLYGPRQLEYVIFSKDGVEAPAAATEEELRSMYGRLAGRLFSQESAQVRYLAVSADVPLPDEAAETALWESASVRTPFIAREDAIPGIGAAPELSVAVFNLKTARDRTEWVEHDGKKYRFELIEHKAQTPMAYEDAQKVLEQMVGQEKTFRALIEKTSKFHESLDKGDWAQSIESDKLVLQKMASYAPDDYIDKIGKLANVGKALSELKAGDVSDPLPTSNGLAVFKVITQSDPDPTLFDEKRADLEKDLRLSHEMEVFGKALQALQANLKINTEVLSKLFSRSA